MLSETNKTFLYIVGFISVIVAVGLLLSLSVKITPSLLSNRFTSIIGVFIILVLLYMFAFNTSTPKDAKEKYKGFGLYVNLILVLLIFGLLT